MYERKAIYLWPAQWPAHRHLQAVRALLTEQVDVATNDIPEIEEMMGGVTDTGAVAQGARMYVKQRNIFMCTAALLIYVSDLTATLIEDEIVPQTDVQILAMTCIDTLEENGRAIADDLDLR